MSVPDLDPLCEALDERVIQLEDEHQRRKERNQDDGSTAAIWRTVEPTIKCEVVEACRSDLAEVEDLDDLLEVLAEWRRKQQQEWEFMKTNSSNENERNNIRRAEIRGWIEQLANIIPESEFTTCGLCGMQKMPKSDRRRKRGYRWECSDCGV